MALSDEGSVEGLLQMLMEQSPAVALKPVSHHCHLFDYALELAKLEERQIVLGMFSILVEEDGWRRLGGLIGELDEGKVRTRVEEAIWTQIRHCHSWAPVADPASEIQSSENRKMRCSNYKPFLVVAEKGPL